MPAGKRKGFLMSIKVTLLYGGLLALWFLVLSIRVIQGRAGPGKPSLGDGGHPAMLRRIRGHANFAEYVPLILLLIGLLELSGVPAWQVHALGGALLAGRLLHGYAFSFTDEHVFGRSAGIALTFVALVGAALLSLYTAALSM
jgi:uncharacterized membrane protein YecN with MAPEG domain